MTESKIKILHIDSQMEWRGGQQQGVYLFESMLKKGYNTLFVCRPKSKLKNYFDEKKLPFIEVNMKAEIDIFSAVKIAKFCKKNGYQILYLHSAGAHSIGLMAKLFYPKIKIIGIRRVDFKIKQNLLSQFKYKSKLVDSIVCISQEIKKVLISCGINDQKLQVIHSGININKFQKSKVDTKLLDKLNIPTNDIIIGTIAALEGHKDYPNLLHAAKIVLDKRKNITFVAVGDGSKKMELEDLHKKLKLDGKFVFAGFQSDVFSFLYLFDVFVLASKTEGLGTSILDAESAGLPIVATKAGGIPEAFENKLNGFLIDIQDSEALANSIIKLIDDEDLRREMGANSKEFVKKFDIEITVNKHLKLIEKLVNS